MKNEDEENKLRGEPDDHAVPESPPDFILSNLRVLRPFVSKVEQEDTSYLAQEELGEYRDVNNPR
jgi:hypothetical protein